MTRWWVLWGAALLALAASGCEHRVAAGAGPRPPATARGLPASMAALGDSLTTGFGSCLFLDSCQRNSWSTGDGLRVDSHFRRIAQANPAIRGHAWNFAAPRARATHLVGQAEAAVARRPEYLTILVGANDACWSTVDAMTSPAAFRAHLDGALAVVKRGLPRSRVLVASVPDLYRLWEIGHTSSRVVRMWNHGVCPALLAQATSTVAADVARRAKVRDRIGAYNRELAAACRAYGSRCRYDGGAVHRVRFTLDMVNVLDFFHPSAAGQNALAAATYPRSWDIGRQW
jgi:lysophospholipase L1-like esterase